MYLAHPNPPHEKDPTVMHRRTLIATALGLSATTLPTWAHAATTTPDADHIRNGATWRTAADNLRTELNQLATYYATEPQMTQHTTTRDSGLWVYAQANSLLSNTPTKAHHTLSRLAAEAAFFAAGCYVDFGRMEAAKDLYERAHHHTRNHPDLRAFTAAQANWVPMYCGNWNAVLRRSDQIIKNATHAGGPGLLMGWMHRAHSLTHAGRPLDARHALNQARRATTRITGCDRPHDALHYSASKVHFSSASVYATLGDTQGHTEARERAMEDPQLGWMDMQIMDIAGSSLDPDTEHAAHTVRLKVVSIGAELSHPVKREAEDALARCKARQVLAGNHTGPEVKALGTYLRNAQVAMAA